MRGVISHITSRLNNYYLAYQICLERLDMLSYDQEWGLLFKSLYEIIDLARENGHDQLRASCNFSNDRISFT
jgi:hypothetical protein